jgi:hypothetical protein
MDPEQCSTRTMVTKIEEKILKFLRKKNITKFYAILLYRGHKIYCLRFLFRISLNFKQASKYTENNISRKK